MPDFSLKFTQTPTTDAGTFKLLELPADLCKLIESSLDTPPSLVIKGDSNEHAVLCTADKTYTVRSVVLSNSILTVTPPRAGEFEHGSSDDLVIRDQIHEVLELVPCLPKLDKLGGLLRGREYDEGRDDEEDMDEDMDDGRPTKRRKLTYEDARAMLQASDVELENGLKTRRVLTLRGELRPIAPSHLTTILELLLNYLVSLSLSHEAAPIEDLAAALEEDHEIRREVSRQVMAWFGETKGGLWTMDTSATVREVGIGIMRAYKNDPIAEDEFLKKWRATVGDKFESVVDLNLLSGNYLSSPSQFIEPPVPLLTYFPASALPVDPAQRFGDLFLTRPRWKAEDIAPFLTDIAFDHKERDRLLLKFARAVTDSEGVWYTARAKYNS
ncbi:hypothetical protein NM688_g6747 [Phlebia brevispora]|uniref:Uncharacterized protein n=1 Tax=Phlebia brevispora TaxID=194682 RepID=A0ACC1SD80_9APHY|nr:hypothetical protein NM688_g6747 [Phlebia brevispora]